MKDNLKILVIGILLIPLGILILHLIDPQLSPAIKFALSFTGTIISLQINSIIKLENMIDRRREYEGYWLALEKNELLKNNLLKITQVYEKIKTNKLPDFFIETFESEIEKTTNQLVKLGYGKIESGNFNDIIPTLKACETTQKEILATSIANIDDYNWWNSPIGKKYLKSNIDAITKGVSIERIFISDNFDDEAQQVMTEHKNKGVKVYKLEKSKIPADYRIDMIVFDRKFSYEAKISADGLPISNIFSVEPTDIASKIKTFEIIKSLSEEV